MYIKRLLKINYVAYLLRNYHIRTSSDLVSCAWTSKIPVLIVVRELAPVLIGVRIVQPLILIILVCHGHRRDSTKTGGGHFLCFHSVMMVFSAQLGEGRGCTSTPRLELCYPLQPLSSKASVRMLQYMYVQFLVASLECVKHRVGRVLSLLSFSQVVEIGTPPTPHLQASVLPHPPPRFWGEGHTRWRDRGGRVPIPTRGQSPGHTLWYSLYIRTLWCKVLLVMASSHLPSLYGQCPCC